MIISLAGTTLCGDVLDIIKGIIYRASKVVLVVENNSCGSN